MKARTKWLLGAGAVTGAIILLSRKEERASLGAPLDRLARLAEGGDEEAIRQLIPELRRRDGLDEYVGALTPRAIQLRFLSVLADQEGWVPKEIPGSLAPILFHGVALCWNAQSARLFAADCAEHVLHLYEQQYPNDMRPRNAIETARRYARGEATEEELAATGEAARTVVRDASWMGARMAARMAAVAAWSSAQVPAGNVARTAAAYAATAATRYRVGGVEGSTVREWQLGRLRQYLLGQVEGVEC